MTQSPQSSPVSRRNKLLTQLLAFIALAVLLYYRPKIEAWVNSGQSTETSSRPDADNMPGSSRMSPRLQPIAIPDEDESGMATLPEFGTSSDPNTDVMPQGERPSAVDAAGTDSAEIDAAEENPEGSGSENDEATKSATDRSEGNADKSGSSSKTSSAGSEQSSPAKKKSSGKSGNKDSVSRMEREPPSKRTAGGSGDIAAENTPKSQQNPEWGKLSEIRNNVFESTAGLVYRSGSKDGHRLKHVMQHAKDDPGKPVHGVFIGEGDRNVVLALIDEAFDKTKQAQNKDVRREEQGDRLVLTVNMKRVVGFMGGTEGERRGHPECRFIRIVLENENEVISAFPTNR